MFRYEEDVKRLEKERLNLPYKPKLLFYGSSTFTLWDSLYQEFEEYQPVNLGFGGSTLAACVWFFDRIVAPFHPEGIVIYAGDNDLEDGRHAEEVFIFYKQLMAKIRHQYGTIPCYFVSIKPSLSRVAILDKIKFTNKIIKEDAAHDPNLFYINLYSKMIDSHGHPKREFFKEDGLHLNAHGYDLWKNSIKSSLSPALLE